MWGQEGGKSARSGLEQEGQTSESRHLVGELTSYETETAGGVTRNLSVATHQTHILYTAVLIAPHHPADCKRSEIMDSIQLMEGSKLEI